MCKCASLVICYVLNEHHMYSISLHITAELDKAVLTATTSAVSTT